MVRGRAVRGWALGLVALGASAAVLWACGQAGRIHGTVTESLNSTALPGAFMGLTRTADSSYVASTCADVNGDYEFTGLTPDGYTVSAGDMAYQPKTANVTVTAGGDVDQDFVLDPIPANLKAKVVSLDQSSGGRTGDCRSVQVEITFQAMCHQPERLVVWAWGGSPAQAYVIHDGSGSPYYNYTCWLDSTVSPNETTSGFDTVATLRFPWDTRWIPNGYYTLKAALICADPHKDGDNTAPPPPPPPDPPPPEHWVHMAGKPPGWPSGDAPGGSVLSVEVCNVVITGYNATPSAHSQHYFRYDADGGSPLDSPQVTATVDNWQNEPMELVVWMIATAWGDTRPNPYTDPYMTIAIGAPGTYTLTWDGSNPGLPPLGWGPGEAPWGTYTYDIDVHKPSCAASMDHFFAKTHDGWSTAYATIYDTLFGDHSVQWTQAAPGDPLVLRCAYEIGSDSQTPPAWVKLVPVDPDLNEQGCVNGGVDLWPVIHDGLPPTGNGSGPGIATFSTTNPDDTVGTWRVVLTGQTATGADLRRDGTNPVMLATNGVFFQEAVHIFLNTAPDGGIVTTSPADPNPAWIVAAIRNGLRPPGISHLPCFYHLENLDMSMYSNDNTQYPSIKEVIVGSHDHWGFLMGDRKTVEEAYRDSIRHVITVSERAFPAGADGVGAGYGHNNYYGYIYRPDVVAIDTARLKAHPCGPAPASDTEMKYATTHAILHELGHRLGLTAHDPVTGQCVMDEDVQAFLYTNRFTGADWETAMWGGDPHGDDHRTQIRTHLCW